MGNNHNSSALNNDQKFLKKRFKKNKVSPEEFIINLHRKQIKNGIRYNLCDQRRVVFISLIGLYQTWYLCPAPILYSSIFILPLARKWIYFPTRYKNEIKQHIFGKITLFKNGPVFEDFVRLLKWKESQKLVFWMIGENEYENEKYEIKERDENNVLVSPFWKSVNARLRNLYDPISKSRYKAIIMNEKWWKLKYNKSISCKSRFNVKYPNILCELYFVTMKYKAIQEIIYQSNPDSLNPILAYDYYESNLRDSYLSVKKKEIVEFNYKAKLKSFVSEKKHLCDQYGFVLFENGCCDDISDIDSDNEGIWMISADYDEYDISQV